MHRVHDVVDLFLQRGFRVQVAREQGLQFFSWVICAARDPARFVSCGYHPDSGADADGHERAGARRFCASRC